MYGGSSAYYITGTGDVAGTSGGQIGSVTLTPAAAVSTLTLKWGGSGGTTFLVLQAAANGNSVQVQFNQGLVYGGQLHATLAGSGASAMIEI